MSERSWRHSLQDIMDAIDFVSENLEGVPFEEFASNQLLNRSILHTLEIAGEAVKGIPGEFMDRHPDIPWRGMSYFRNVIAHEYFRVDLQLVWRVIHREFLPLRDHIGGMLESTSNIEEN